MLVTQVAVRLHRQRTAVFVAEPPADRRDIHTALNAARGEEVAKVVVADPDQGAGDGGRGQQNSRTLIVTGIKYAP